MDLKTSVPWKSQREGFLEALNYMKGRMNGTITSLHTPWRKFDDAGIDGIEWNSVVVIGARPGNGKTLIKDQIVRESFKRNPGEDFRVLEFQFEMLQRTSAIREFSSVTEKTYQYLNSAERDEHGNIIHLTPEQLEVCFQYAKERVKYPIDIVDTAATVEAIARTIDQYLHHYSVVEETPEGDKRIYKKTLITLDHTILVKQAPHEKAKQDMLYALGEMLTAKKRQYPISFIVLSQLNRNVDDPDRCKDGQYANFILESDFFGADAMLQHADIQIGVTCPAKRYITRYGPDRYIVDDETLLVMHFIKCRNGSGRVSFFKSEFQKMMISERATPPTEERKISTKK